MTSDETSYTIRQSSWRSEAGTEGRLAVILTLSRAGLAGPYSVAVTVSAAGAHVTEHEPRIAKSMLGLKKHQIERVKHLEINYKKTEIVGVTSKTIYPIVAYLEFWPECVGAAATMLEEIRTQVLGGLAPYTIVERPWRGEVPRLRSFERSIDSMLTDLRDSQKAPNNYNTIKMFGSHSLVRFEKKCQWHVDEYFEFEIEFYIAPGVAQVAYDAHLNCGFSGAAPEHAERLFEIAMGKRQGGLEFEDDYEDDELCPSFEGPMEIQPLSSRSGVIAPNELEFNDVPISSKVNYGVFCEAIQNNTKNVFLEIVAETLEMVAEAKASPETCEIFQDEEVHLNWAHGPDQNIIEGVVQSIELMDTLKLYESMEWLHNQ